MLSWDRAKKITKPVFCPGRKPGETKEEYKLRYNLWQYERHLPSIQLKSFMDTYKYVDEFFKSGQADESN